ncbi:hypothetical protein [Candidatus Alkanophaga liquidiphilum]
MPVRIRFAKSKLSHEARPLTAYRTMANVAMSPMSQEIAVFSVFVVFLLIYTILWVFELEFGLFGGTALAKLVGRS